MTPVSETRASCHVLSSGSKFSVLEENSFLSCASTSSSRRLATRSLPLRGRHDARGLAALIASGRRRVVRLLLFPVGSRHGSAHVAIRGSFKESSSKKLILNLDEDKKKFEFQRSAELIYGLRNFIGNAVKFSKSTVEIKIKSNDKNLEVSINDDGPGFPEDIKEFLGEPYIKSKSYEVNSNAGTGLGTFLGKTLLERKSARLSFSKDNKLGGASVNIFWKQIDLKSNV